VSDTTSDAMKTSSCVQKQAKIKVELRLALIAVRQIFRIFLVQICFQMRKVSDILRRKGNNVTTVAPSITVIDALHIMAEQNIGSVVVAENNKFLGIMTERDYSRKVILKGRNSNDTKVGDIMTTDFPPVASSDTVEHCMELMSNQNLRYLPVLNGESLAGIISINDVVKETILTQQETISHLQDYIHS